MFIISPIARTIISEVVIIFGVDAHDGLSSSTNNTIYRYNGSTLSQESQRIVNGGSGGGAVAPFSFTGAKLNNVAYLFGRSANFTIVTYDGYKVSNSFTVPGFTSAGMSAVSTNFGITIMENANGLGSIPGYLFNGTSISVFNGSIGTSTNTTGGAGCAYMPNSFVFIFGGHRSGSTPTAHGQINYLDPASLSSGTHSAALNPARTYSTAIAINDFNIKIFGGYQFNGTSSTWTLFDNIENFNGISVSKDIQVLPQKMYSQVPCKMGSDIMLFGGNITTSVGVALLDRIMRYNGTSISTESISLPSGVSDGSDVAINLNLPNGTT